MAIGYKLNEGILYMPSLSKHYGKGHFQADKARLEQ